MRVVEGLREIGLPHAASKYEELAQLASKEKFSYEEFTLKLIEEEKKERARRREEVLLRLSNLPVIKTFAGFDFSFNPSIDKKMIEELRSLRFIEEHSNLLFLGPPGVGKTHLAIALGVEAIKRGYLTYFTTVDEIARRLKTTKEEYFPRRLRNYRKAQLLIIDEIGYLPLDKEEANLLFQVISTRYEKGSIIITSNKSIIEWGEYLADPVLASALLDRLLHHSYVINIRGKSYRIKGRLKHGEKPR